MSASTIPQLYKNIRTIYLAIAFGAKITFIILYFVSKSQSQALLTPATSEFLLGITWIITLSGIGLGYYLTRQQLQALDTTAPLEDKLTRYRSVSLIQYALTEAPILFSAVCYFLTHDTQVLSAGIVAMLWMIFLHPAPEKVGAALSLTASEQALLTQKQTPLK